MNTERLAQLNRESQEILDAVYGLALKGNVLAASIYLDSNLSADCSDCTEAESAENLEKFLRDHLPGHFDGKATNDHYWSKFRHETVVRICAGKVPQYTLSDAEDRRVVAERCCLMADALIEELRK